MKTATQTQPELAQLCRLIVDIPVAMLTTVDPDQRLESRPMAPLEMDESGAIWFYTSTESSKVSQLGSVNLAFVNHSDANYVSLAGRAELVNDRERIKRLWTTFASPWFPQGVDSPDLTLLKFTPATAEYWDAPNSRMVRLLAVAMSAAAGAPIGMGKHETFENVAGAIPKTGHD